MKECLRSRRVLRAWNFSSPCIYAIYRSEFLDGTVEAFGIMPPLTFQDVQGFPIPCPQVR